MYVSPGPHQKHNLGLPPHSNLLSNLANGIQQYKFQVICILQA